MSAKREFGVMKGQKVLVTGAGTGIGRGVALEFSRAGADVVLHYSASSEGAESAAEAINSSGGCAKAIGGDFRDIQAVKETARLAIEFLGGIDVLVNNVGQTIVCDGGQTLIMPQIGDFRGRRSEKWGDRYLKTERDWSESRAG